MAWYNRASYDILDMLFAQLNTRDLVHCERQIALDLVHHHAASLERALGALADESSQGTPAQGCEPTANLGDRRSTNTKQKPNNIQDQMNKHRIVRFEG